MSDPYAPPATQPLAGGPPPPPTPGRPAVAAVLSLLAVGAGHVYAGRPLRGLRWLGLFAVTLITAGALARPSYLTFGFAGLTLGLLVPLGVYFAAIRDAAGRAPSRPKRHPTWIVVGGLLGFWLARTSIALLFRTVFVEAFRIPSGGVLPTLAIGDHIFADKLLPRMRRARRGELVVFPFPEHPDEFFIQRAVALPGDTVRIEGGRLFINGWQVPRCDVGRWTYHDEESGSHDGDLAMEFLGDAAYLVFDDANVPSGAIHAREWHVAGGELFAMGDNRNNSHDSRMWYGGRGGGIPLRTVRGFALTVWLSVNDKGVDWDRFGADLTGRKPLAPPGLEADVARCLANRPSGTVGPPS